MEEAVLTGRILAGRYRLGERLGQGGWGSVYAAVQMDLGRPVAIKVLHTSVALAPDGLARFEREAKAAAALGHPNIAQVSDFAANLGEPPFLVMELLTGATLGAAMRESSRLAPARMAWIAYQILAGLDVAHNAGIVHRDIKPDNVFLVAMPGVEDFVKLLDFGIAKLSSESSQHLTTTGTMLGSPAFMAPEQVRSNDVDHRVDLYAVGACYAATEFDPPDHQFTDWIFQVDSAGNVKSVGRASSFEPHAKFDACMVGALRQVKWPASKAGGSPRVSFTARTRDNP